MSSPSERFFAAQKRQHHRRSQEFIATIDFPLDSFQINAIHAIEDGYGVLVAAPTGAGKTLVGQFATYLANRAGVKCFYTTPIKALSNQKFQEFVDIYGEEQVGLLTGDTSINGEAQIVVMTTEVLRNMIYAGSSTLHSLEYVVMDEVHFLGDKFRGAVWEEILIHLPDRIQVISLSATVSNAEEFGDWLNVVRGETKVIVSEDRPVPLYQHVLMRNRLLDLFVDDGRINPEILQFERESARRLRTTHQRDWNSSDKRSQRQYFLSKPEIIELLEEQDYLPAIFFIFSRAGCDSAVRQCVADGLNLTTPSERKEIQSIINEKTASLPHHDYEVVNFHQWSDALLRGIGAHHAGLLPVFKETVESLFQLGLLPVVFATETLALGINMPAHTVVLEKLSKWNGESHVTITPGEYTQLTGRAGRRGIDIEGHAVVLWNNSIDSGIAAGLATTRSFPLKSSFVPSYNMSANLISRFGYQRARDSLAASFAQFQADRAVVGLSRQIDKNRKVALEFMESAQCDKGDFSEFMDFRLLIKKLEKDLRDREGRRTLTPSQRTERVETIEMQISELRIRQKNHPVHLCPEREAHARLHERAHRLLRENETLTARMESRTQVIPRIFDRVTSVLKQCGYIDGDVLTDRGITLTRVFSERDFLISELIAHRFFEQLSATQCVAVISACTYDGRLESKFSPRLPQSLEDPLNSLLSHWIRVSSIEESNGLTPLKEPSWDFVWHSYRWANGHSLHSILRESEISPGDFIRSIRQVIDLLGQLSEVMPQCSATLREAIHRIDRGIVAYSGVTS